MGNISFEVKTYSISYAQEHGVTINDTSCRFPANITVRGQDMERITFYFMENDVTLPEPKTITSRKWAAVFRYVSEMPALLQILQNEKPVHASMYDGAPKYTGIYVGDEPVGEEES